MIVSCFFQQVHKNVKSDFVVLGKLSSRTKSLCPAVVSPVFLNFGGGQASCVAGESFLKVNKELVTTNMDFDLYI